MAEKIGLYKRIFSQDRRLDGRLVQDLDATQQIVPYFMKSRQASSIYLRETFDITRTLSYLEQHNEQVESERYTLFIVLIVALVHTGVLHPKLNRFVSGKKIYARNKLQVSFTMKQELSAEGKELVIKLTFHPQDTIVEVSSKVNDAIKKARKHETSNSNYLIHNMLKLPSGILTIIFSLEKYLDHWGLLPASLIDADPLFSSVFVANLGSLDVGAPYHPLYERGTISVFIVLGKYKEITVSDKDDQSTHKQMVDVTFTVDSRIAGGYAIAQALQSFKTFMEHPERLEIKPEQIKSED